MLKDTEPGLDMFWPSKVVPLGELGLFIAGSCDDHGLWRTDGTEAGTQRLGNVSTGCSDPYPSKDAVYFNARGSDDHWQLWRTDGTEAGTVPAGTLIPAMDGASSLSMIDVNGQLYFMAPADSGYGLWRTDGTSAGTVLVKSSLPLDARGFTSVDGKLFFWTLTDSETWGFWKSDGTEAGTVKLKDFGLSAVQSAHGRQVGYRGSLYFSYAGSLWTSDGTAAGTRELKKISDDAFSGGPCCFNVLNDTLFFVDASDSDRIWKTDGTEAGTVVVKCMPPFDNHVSGLTACNGKLYFGVGDFEDWQLWSSDGTEAGTIPLPILAAEIQKAWYHEFTSLGDRLYVSITQGNGASALWSTDGTGVGTILIGTFTQTDMMSGNVCPTHLSMVNGMLFFAGDDGVHGPELWMTRPENRVNHPPLANAGGPYTIHEGDDLILDASASCDPDGNTLTYSWDINGDGIFGDATGVIAAVSWTQLRAFGITDDGTFPGVQVQVTDVGGPSISRSQPLTVLNTPPDVLLGATDNPHLPTCAEGITTCYFAMVYDPGDDHATSVTIDWGDGTPVVQTTPGGSGSHAYADNGEYHVTYWITDEDGTHVRDHIFYVENRAPTLQASMPAAEATGNPVTLNLSATDVGQDTISSWTIVWGDGQTQTLTDRAATVTHIYSSSGAFRVAISATDEDGAYDVSPKMIFIHRGYVAPTIQGDDHASTGGQYTLHLAATGDLADCIQTWSISWGDGLEEQVAGNLSSVTHTYTRSGSFTISAQALVAGTWYAASLLGHSTGLPIASLVRDINPGPGGSGIQNLMDLNGTLFFTASDGTSVAGLWKSDSTPQGTVAVREAQAGTPGSQVSFPAVAANRIFYLSMGKWYGAELWCSDGTDAGTTLVFDITPDRPETWIGKIISHADAAYFTLVGRRSELWRTDGTAAGTTRIAPPGGRQFESIGEVVSSQGKLLFTARCGDQAGLWITDGTPDGTVCVVNLPAASILSPAAFADSYIFYADKSSEHSLMSGLTKLRTIYSGPETYVQIGGKLFFNVIGSEYGYLMVTDGTPQGTTSVSSDNGDPSWPRCLTELNGLLYFMGTDQNGGYGLWRTDGTRQGTVPVTLFSAGTPGSAAGLIAIIELRLIRSGNHLYFTAGDESTGGIQLWESDGTTEGTVPVTHFSAQLSQGNRRITTLGTAGGKFYFAADDGQTGDELWMLSPAAAPTPSDAQLPVAVSNPDPPPQPSICAVGPAVPGESVLLVGNIANGSLTGCQYAWDFGDSPSANLVYRPLKTRTPSIRHTYLAPGTYKVALAVRNAQGTVNRTTWKIRVQPFALRTSSGKTTLLVGGTTGHDQITFDNSRGRIEVKLNGKSLGRFNADGLIAYGQAGNDRIQVDSRVAIAAELYGGDGNDLLQATAKHSILSGGRGHNTLIGPKRSSS